VIYKLHKYSCLSLICIIFERKMFKIKYPIINGQKQCSNCGYIKSISEFYKHKNYYRSYCKQCSYKHTKDRRNDPEKRKNDNEKQKEYFKQPEVKRKKLISYKNRLSRIKKEAVVYKGGECKICGYNKCLSALEFHHINPNEKDKKLNSRGIDRRKSFNNLKSELDKCILVCCRCHREIHENIIKL
jgi:hypothetical protein